MTGREQRQGRVAGVFAGLLALLVVLLVALVALGDRMIDRHADRAGGLLALRDDNAVLLRSLTDAESGLRGFQLTGDRSFLDRYETGRAGVRGALERLAAGSPADVRPLVAAESDAVAGWLYGYAIPIVNAGTTGTDAAALARGEALADRVRAAGSDLVVAVEDRRAAIAATEAREARATAAVLAALVVLLAGLGAAVLGQRRRYARLAADERARAAANALRDAVGEELLTELPPGETSFRILTLIGTALGADAACARVTVRESDGLAVSWPAGTPEIEADAPGALTVPLAGDTGCPPGFVRLVRAGREWTAAERAQLETLGRDIDHEVRRRRLQLRQTRLINELRVLDEQKETFVATVTHELRTPLTSILGYTEMLADGAGGVLSPTQERALTAILRNAHRLEATVSDVMVLDRSSERVGVEAVPVDLAELAAALHADLGPATRAKALDSALDVEPAWVRGVDAQLQRALRNLMENAIKFTPAGGRLECRLTADDRHVVITISDTGIGIPADDVPGLFTPFHRARNAMDKAVQGSGLGLAIVRNIVAEHGGTVAAHSELGQGSTFTMTLPAIPAEVG